MVWLPAVTPLWAKTQEAPTYVSSVGALATFGQPGGRLAPSKSAHKPNRFCALVFSPSWTWTSAVIVHPPWGQTNESGESIADFPAESTTTSLPKLTLVLESLRLKIRSGAESLALFGLASADRVESGGGAANAPPQIASINKITPSFAFIFIRSPLFRFVVW